MPVDDVEIAIRATDEYSGTFNRFRESAATTASKVKESFEGINSAQGEMVASLGKLDGIFKRIGDSFRDYATAAEAAKQSNVSLFESLGQSFLFLKQREENYAAAKVELEDADKRLIDAAAKKFTALQGYDEMRMSSIASLSAVHSSAYAAMGGQMLRLVDIGRFSAAAFVRVVAQQVKTELVGLAAKAGVWAIYEVAMGLKDLASLSPATAAIHFASAKQFGMVAAASLAAAAGVQSALPGGAAGGKGADGTKASPKSMAGGPVVAPASPDPYAQARPVQAITVQIYNPLSQQNWTEIVENEIIPAINDATENRNISLTVKTV